MTEVISVRFRGGCKNYYFDPRGAQVKMGDQVIVETAQGPEFATCTEGNHEVDESAIVKPLCAVLRMATDNDRRTVEQNKKKESEAFDICERKIADHGLEMKLVNVSASFDGTRSFSISPRTAGWISGSWCGIWRACSAPASSCGRSACGMKPR